MYSKIKEYLKENLSEERYLHTISVCEECMELCRYFDFSEDKRNILYLSALLHDITKENNSDAQIELCRIYNIDYTKDEIASPAIFHQKTGGAFAREKFGEIVTDEVIENISTHTTGAENMSIMQKLLFVADCTEPTRKHKSCVELRKFLYRNLGSSDSLNLLNRVCLMSLDSTVSHLIGKENPIDIQTVKARNFLLSEVKNYEKF